MANSNSAAKRARQNTTRRDRHRARRTETRSVVRAVRTAADEGNQEQYKELLSAAFSSLDRAAKTGAMHTGTANRTKRRLAALGPKIAS
jgi:small subunit ribosomal protein S20